jgi:hypothetical protein
MSTAVPLFSLGVLHAPVGTPLHDRFEREHRLIPDEDLTFCAGSFWSTNIIPNQLTREQLLEGTITLVRRIYHPTAFGERLIRLIDQLGTDVDRPADNSAAVQRQGRRVEMDYFMLSSRLRWLGPLEEQLFERTVAAVTKKPSASKAAFLMLAQYMQVRTMIEQYFASRSLCAVPA